jgi:hypothetical protein
MSLTVRSRLRIVVTGLAATYPVGGVFWDYLQYALGFVRLGHDVLYVEDTGRWVYDPVAATFVESGERNATLLAERLKALDTDLAEHWFYRDGTGRTYGCPWADVVEFCRTADLFLHISASCWMREEYFAARRVVFVDSDPMYTQASLEGYLAGTVDAEARARVEVLRQHDRFFTFAENIGAPDCRIPTALFDWIPTRQPIVLDCFEPESVPVAARRRVLTTVASWEPSDDGGPVIGGVAYAGKSGEFARFMDLPARCPFRLELALSGQVPADTLRAHGWALVDPYAASKDPWVYRRYLATSLAEWSVAKQAYVASRSGWFSCRSACYLALGVPVVVQDTGFGCAIPVGRGVLPFATMDEAVDAIQRLAADPAAHAEAALAIAREHFDSNRVLGRLIDRALSHG